LRSTQGRQMLELVHFYLQGSFTAPGRAQITLTKNIKKATETDDN